MLRKAWSHTPPSRSLARHHGSAEIPGHRRAVSPGVLPSLSPRLRPRLVGMSLGNVIISPRAVTALINLATPLRELRLTGRWLVHPRTFHALLQHLFGLRALDVTGYLRLTDQDVAAVVDTCACKHTLRRFATNSVALVSPVFDFPRLESLSLGHCTALTEPRFNCPALSWLSIPYCRRLSSGVLHSLLHSLPSLLYLDARGCRGLTVRAFTSHNHAV